MKKIKKAVFPVGGFGTRFLPITKSIPKEMFPFVDKPIIHYAVEEAIKSGIEEFIFVVGAGKDAIKNYFSINKNLEEHLRNNEKFVEFVTDDSVKFLSSFSKNIDFLYLDSLDGQFKEASDHQLNEIKVAKSKLHKKSLVLLDDKESKTNLSIDFMLENNFKIINETKEQ